MKKLFSLVLCLMMAAALIPASAEGALKTGLAAVVTLTPADATENKDGQVRNEVTFAAVTVDEDGKIVDCKIDSYRADITFDATGKLTKDAGTKFDSKREMGEAYGMGAVAPKGEWDKQTEGFAAYCVGKTLDEIKGIALNEEGKATDEDILATTTISMGDFVKVVALAVEKAEDHGAQAGDELKLVSVADMHASKDASENKDGATQLDATYAAVTLKDGVITGIVIDAVQPKATFSAEGKVTGDTTAEVLSKLEKGDAYGMNGVAPKGEWYQQVAGFCAYVTGKTAADAAGIAMGEDGKATDEDLLATTTISIGEFVSLLEKLTK